VALFGFLFGCWLCYLLPIACFFSKIP